MHTESGKNPYSAEKSTAPLAAESLADFSCSATMLEQTPDMLRFLLEIFRVLQPGGLLHLACRKQKGHLTTWTELFAELLFPHLARLRSEKEAAWYNFTPTVLRSFMRHLFDTRMQLQDKNNLVWRKICSLAQAFPWTVVDTHPAIRIQSDPKNLHLDAISPIAAPFLTQPPLAQQKQGTSGISIVMALRNAEQALPQTLASLAEQTQPPLELVIQDGASSDATLAIVQKFKEQTEFPVLLESAADTGIYQAWNRAISRVHGEWLLFLGADDRFTSRNVLAKLLPMLQNLNTSILLAYGSLEFFRAEQKVDIWNPEKTAALDRMSPAADRRFLPGMGLPFPATLLRSAIFRTHAFDESYRIAGDFRLIGEIASTENLVQLPLCITRMQLGGISSSPEKHVLTEAERIRASRELGLLP